MKFKAGFSLIVILIALFSIGIVAASENTTEHVGESQATEYTLQMDAEPSLMKNSEPAADLFVDIENDCKSYVVKGDTVTWKITVENEGDLTAHDTKVYTTFYDQQYVSHHAGVGTYDKKTGIWKVGDLLPKKSKSLTVKTKVTMYLGDALCECLATTSSYDDFIENNYLNDAVFVGDPSRSITSFYDLIRMDNPNRHYNNFEYGYSSSTSSSDDEYFYNHPEHYFSSGFARSSSINEPTNTKPVHKPVKAESVYMPAKIESNTIPLESDNSNNLNNSNHTDYKEPISIRKAVVDFSENKFSIGIILLAAILLVLGLYKRK